MTVRPAAGPSGRCLVVEEGVDAAEGRIWAPATGLSDVLPVPVGFGTLLTPDGRWLVDLDDGGGSEVGGLVRRRVDGSRVEQLAPDRPPSVVRGLEASADGEVLLATVVDEDGHHLLHVPMGTTADTRVLFSSPEEAWFGHLSADAALACVDTIEHNPGIRRAAVTVVDCATGEVVATADDLPAGPVRAVRFSPVPGDPRILLSTERTGFARPALWDPVTGERTDFALPELDGELLVLDWAPGAGRILVVEVSEGRQRLLAVDDTRGTVEVVHEGGGSYAEPDVAAEFPYYWQSFLGPDGEVMALTSAWTTPLHLVRTSATGSEVVVPPVDVPPGRPLDSAMVESDDGTRVQLWWAAPDGPPRGTVLDVHGGPNLVTVDAYRPDLQSWLDAGFAVASLNYRGSVSFGQAFREGFWGGAGDREIEDVAAAVGWLRERGLADPASTFITGPSYGGHLSLLSIGRLPDLFAGAFAIVAMADWSAAWAEMNPALRKSWTSFLSMGADGTFDSSRIDEALERFSSINHVDDVTASAWLYQGLRDTRTPPEQARTYAERLRAAGGDVLLDWFDAGHEPTGIEGVRVEFERMLELAELASAAGRGPRRRRCGRSREGAAPVIGGLAPHRFERDGVGLAAWSGGSGPTVLLLHGYPQSSYMWRDVAAPLLGSHHVVVMDLRGYGESDAPPPDPGDLTYSKREMAADAAFVLDSLGVDRAHLVGHDRGGRVVHRFCLDFPELVLTAAVLDIVPTLHMFESVDRAMAEAYFHWFFLTRPGGLPEALIRADPERWLRSRFAGRHGPAFGFEEHFVAEYLRSFTRPGVGRGDLLGLPRGRLGRPRARPGRPRGAAPGQPAAARRLGHERVRRAALRRPRRLGGVRRRRARHAPPGRPLRRRGVPRADGAGADGLLGRLVTAWDRARALDRLDRLVSTESPSGDADRLDQVYALLAEWGGQALGRAPERVEVGGVPHLLWRTAAPPAALVLCHADTVFPAGTTDRRPFRVEDGRATGPGVFDMKAGIVVALDALERVSAVDGVGAPGDRRRGDRLADLARADRGRRPRRGRGPGARAAPRRRAQGRPQGRRLLRGDLPRARRARGARARAGPQRAPGPGPVGARGHRARSAGARHDGHADARVVRDRDQRRARPRGAVRRRARLDAGRDAARRPGPARLARTTSEDGAEVAVAVDGGINRSPLETESSAGLVALCREVAARLGLDEPRTAVVGGGSDGNFTAALGVPTLDGLGASGDGAHAEHEWVEVDSMGEQALLVAALLDELVRRRLR